MEKANFWSRTKISTLSALLLGMMIMAGVFFTAAFLFIQSNTDTIHQHWTDYQQASTSEQSEQLAVLVEEQINSVSQVTTYFIIAVLLAVTAFVILMYATLIVKIARPLSRMQQGITDITSSNDFSTRLPIKFEDEVGQVLHSFNHLTENLKTVFDVTNSKLDKVAMGQFDQTIDVNVSGDLLHFKDNVNASIKSVAHTMSSLEMVAEAIAQGDFSVRMDETIKGDLKQKIDHAMLSMDEIVENINHVMGEVSNCQLNQRIHVDANGRLNDLKTYVNNALDTLENGLNAINSSIEHLSERNLTFQIKESFSGEMEMVKQQLNHTTQQLNSTLDMVSLTSQSVHNDVALISESNQDLAKRSQQQAGSIEQTAAAMEEMTSAVSQSAENAMRASQLTNDTRKLADKGVVVMNASVESMQQIQQSSVRISDIVALIDSIAFQTNLLALNAAVEAARAGEQGRGFAVVAGEVRSLAQKSSDAAQDIRNLIDEVVNQVNHGADQLNQTNETFSEITNGIQTVNNIVEEMTSTSKEQALGIQQVNESISKLDQGIQQNNLMVEENSKHSNQLLTQANQLMEEVQLFKTDRTLALPTK
ncbi:MAG: methyl-accepting chemotaxis protein [Pseudomonadota bacterium]|nr:methyl-accepting chemotaxis protein [Pseudomonadota bacterium]